jgi:phosphoribosyl-ATP pyrophosphohydrolase
MISLENRVIEWHKETFPNATNEAVLAKLHEELLEVISAKDQGELVMEIADITIVSIVLLERLGFSLENVVYSKMAINQARQWGPEDETGNRVKIS